MITRAIALCAMGLLLAIGIASCAPSTSQPVQPSQDRYEQAKKNCYSCFGIYDYRCQEPQLSIYVGKDITQICGGVAR